VLSPGQRATVTMATNCGRIVIRLDTKSAPKTSDSVAFLAEQSFYDRTYCHRLTNQGIFILQCGDPTYSGRGTPGYTTPDENLPTSKGMDYPAGTVAMANSGPGTTGSQFFLVYRDTKLPPNYSIVGQITTGLHILTKVANAGIVGGSGDGAPIQSVEIKTMTVQKK
jgi:peptidyl-prolyl cis-trans isomerase B (cyclophilin B)